jgi:hypothetical protein
VCVTNRNRSLAFPGLLPCVHNRDHLESIRNLISCTQFDIVDWFLSEAKETVDRIYEAIKSLATEKANPYLARRTQRNFDKIVKFEPRCFVYIVTATESVITDNSI